jgi:hypothetical protein
MQIILGFIDPLGGVAYGAHIGGFLVGLATGYLWKTLRLYQQQPEASKPNWYYNKSKNRPNIDEMGVNAQPELIKGPDFYEIIAEIRGVTSTSEIKVDYDPNTNIMRIYSIAPSTSEVKIKLPDDVSNPQVNQIQYLNGIVRIRLR